MLGAASYHRDVSTPRPADSFLTLVAGRGIVAWEQHGGGDEHSLYEEEKAAVAAAIESRRCEFAAGRACARAGLRQLGLGEPVILKGDDGAPVWPAGIVGSITHTGDYRLCALGRVAPGLRAIGVDAELSGGVTSDLHPEVFGAEERAALAEIDPRWDAATRMFAAKEALYKAQFPLTRSWIDFHEVVALPADVAAGTLSLRGDRSGLPWPVVARTRHENGIVVAAVVF